MPSPDSSRPSRSTLLEIARVFLRLGATAFGGPAAHIAMMEQEIVARRGWLSRADFLDYVGASHLIPGPNSTELAIHVGLARGGWRGLLVAGASFILPAACIVTAIAWGYVRYHELPDVTAVLQGVTPVVIAIIVQALWGLGRTALKSRGLIVVAAGAIVAAAVGVHELMVLAGAAAAMLADGLLRGPRGRGPAIAMFLGGGVGGAHGVVYAAAPATGAVPFSLSTLFLVFAKIGSVLFGSGYVLLAFLRADFVERLGWLTEQQLIDATAVGQVTPGPLFTTATFVGYLLGGPSGAAVATLGIFLPAFVFVALSAPLIPRLRRSPTAGAVLDGVNAASLALMAVVTVQLATAAFVDAMAVAIVVLSGAVLFARRVNSTWLILAGAAAGWLWYR